MILFNSECEVSRLMSDKETQAIVGALYFYQVDGGKVFFTGVVVEIVGIYQQSVELKVLSPHNKIVFHESNRKYLLVKP